MRKHPNALVIWMISIFAGLDRWGWIVALAAHQSDVYKFLERIRERMLRRFWIIRWRLLEN
jgi:hypothetical protein